MLDLLPQRALEGVTVLPLATGGSTAHVLAFDYGPRPVLASMGPAHITPADSCRTAHRCAGGRGVVVEPAARKALERVADQFSAALGERVGLELPA